MNNLNKLVSRHYEQQSLSPHRRILLEQKLERIRPAKEPIDTISELGFRDKETAKPGGGLRWFHYATATVLLVLTTTVLQISSIDNERSEMALHAAALYHKTKLQLDFEGHSITELRNKMSKLPFSLSLPDTDNLRNLTLIGGRYCSINGQLAAHLRFVSQSSGQRYSLFQTSLVPDLQRLDIAETEVEGMPVRLWNNDKYFYVQAGG